MRIDVFCEDRTGMTHAVLGVLAESGIDLATVEMVTEHVYLNAPTLDKPKLGRLRKALLAVDGVRSVEPLEIMPAERRELLLNTLVGTQGKYTTEEVSSFLKDLIVSRLTDLLGSLKVGMLDLPARFEEIGAAILHRAGLKRNPI